MIVGDRDTYARQADFDWLRGVVDDLRTDVLEDGRRRDDRREEDNKLHASAHKALGERIDGYKRVHDARHQSEATARSKGAAEKKDKSWVRGAALASAAAGVASAATAVLAYLHGH